MIGEERDSGVPVIGVLLPNRILLRVMSMTEELLALLAKHTFSSHEQTPFHTALPSVTLVRASNGRYPRYILHRPALCMVLQGTKRTVFGDMPFDYSAGQALVVTTTMPGVSRIIEADALHPYLGIIVEFDMVILRDVFIQLSQRPIQKNESSHAAFVVDTNESLYRCVLRGLRLLDTPDAIPVLHTGFMQELCYWLLTGPNGADIARVIMGDGHSAGVLSALALLRDKYTESLSLDALAKAANLSRSAFHRKFKDLTGMSPLDYQKQLRLLEARQLLLAHNNTAEAIAFQVGYNSPNQFSREYSRMFGLSPRKDALALR
ncbi:MAG: AraC family transcriptional regulator [Enterobacteriaceae bacterium]|uniref:AraC family transcriptional regulator n=1 Tax=Hafnia paralvei TaxID=546367 RepID=UPI0009EF3043|nr:AraC family transcriptional regulator [Hafnia paralvei]MDU1191963.1 AraC family transcriptional regulator [Enterobacteriaceae bacterium]MDU1243866.1 AraC family transcriptional regulator [Enterobacteriaceae bacterium]HCU16354.1 AraC family transcriptional regulator [Hafnia paralvei]